MKTFLSNELGRRIRSYAPVHVVAAVGVAVSISAWYFTLITENRAFIQDFSGRAENQAIILQNGIDDYWNNLQAVRALFDSSNTPITREEFERFSNSLLANRAGILNIAWIPRVKREERLAHEAAAIGDGVPNYHIRIVTQGSDLPVSPERDEYFPKFYSTEARTAPVYGLDLNDEGVRARVIARIRDNDVL